MNNLQCRKAYVRVNLDVDEEGTIIPMLIRWKDGRVFQIDQLKYKCRAISNKVVGGGIRYDLWTTEDGKCMVRVKITGEVTEVDRKVMRILRAEEKRLRRSKQGVPISGTEGKTAEERASVLSLSYVSYEGCEDLEPYWLIDSSSMEESVMFWMSEKEFRATLTPRQLDIYLNCIIGGQSKIDYAAANNMQRQSVYNAATLIMKKAKYFFKKF